MHNWDSFSVGNFLSECVITSMCMWYYQSMSGRWNVLRAKISWRVRSVATNKSANFRHKKHFRPQMLCNTTNTHASNIITFTLTTSTNTRPYALKAVFLDRFRFRSVNSLSREKKSQLSSGSYVVRVKVMSNIQKSLWKMAFYCNDAMLNVIRKKGPGLY